MAGPLDYTGREIHYSDDWDPVDVSVEDFKPGKVFRLHVGTPGKLCVVGNGMKAQNCVPIFLTEGYHSLLCKAILNHVDNSAAEVTALY